MKAVENKSETLNLRVSPQLKAALRLAADKERRSMANMVEFLVFQYCQEHNLLENKLTESTTASSPALPTALSTQ